MKLRRYTQGITIFTTSKMYHEVKRVSDEMEVSLSELFREMITEYLDHRQSGQSGSND
jgi:metal-responsive CopG/Arc/MetJ family transcriptional regulator